MSARTGQSGDQPGDHSHDRPDDEWAGDRVRRWLHQAPALERQFAAVSRLLFEAARIGAGEAVLDVGCGAGATTAAAAALAGPTGQVSGLDISGEMLAAARRHPVPDRSGPLSWIETDVVTWQAPVARFDVVFSRFGVMFFSDPPLALDRLAKVVRPGGRLAFAVWGRRDQTPLFEMPYRVVRRVCAERAHDLEDLPADRGPFAWHDTGYVSTLLDGAGWHGVDVATHTVSLPFGGGVVPIEAAAAALDFGPTRALLLGADDQTREAARAALAVAFADHLDAAGHVRLDASLRVVTARR